MEVRHKFQEVKVVEDIEIIYLRENQAKNNKEISF